MIIPKEDRIRKLTSHGVPIEFLDALDDTSKFEDLEFIVNGPESAYWYLQDIYPKYECIKDYDVTPIYCGGNNDTFMYCSQEKTKFDLSTLVLKMMLFILTSVLTSCLCWRIS